MESIHEIIEYSYKQVEDVIDQNQNNYAGRWWGSWPTYIPKSILISPNHFI